jgi:hypothetical protein
MKRALTFVVLGLLPSFARAEPVVTVTVNVPEPPQVIVEAPAPLPPVPPPVPPPVIAPPPLVVVPPPAFAPEQCPAPTSCDYLDDLERRGRSKKIAGGLMIGIGMASLIGGAIAAGWAAVDHAAPASYGRYERDDAIIIGGAVASFLGGLTMLAGIPVTIVGSYQVGKARRLRATLAPVVGANQAGASLLVRF